MGVERLSVPDQSPTERVVCISLIEASIVSGREAPDESRERKNNFAAFIGDAMSSRSLNKVLLIGNLSQDPELRYTPQGTAVCTFSIATNRSWTDQSGQQQDVAEFTRCVAWAKLAEVCSQLLFKGRKAYIEGRLQTREWEGQDHAKRRTTEVVIENMIALGSPRVEAGSPRFVEAGGPSAGAANRSAGSAEEALGAKIPEQVTRATERKKGKKGAPEKSEVSQETLDEPVPAEDIPF